jgi:hypothetical protein
MPIVTYLIEYLCEFKFIFETILGYESGDQMGSFDAKIRHRKSQAWAPLIWKYHRLTQFSNRFSPPPDVLYKD